MMMLTDVKPDALAIREMSRISQKVSDRGNT